MTDITSMDQFKQLCLSNTHVFIDVYSNWCDPCKKVRPVYDAYAKLCDKAAFACVDMDANEDICNLLNITQVPTFVYIANGHEMDRYSGTNLQTFMAKYI